MGVLIYSIRIQVINEKVRLIHEIHNQIIVYIATISHIQVNQAAEGKFPLTAPLAGADGSTEAWGSLEYTRAKGTGSTGRRQAVQHGTMAANPVKDTSKYMILCIHIYAYIYI